MNLYRLRHTSRNVVSSRSDDSGFLFCFCHPFRLSLDSDSDLDLDLNPDSDSEDLYSDTYLNEVYQRLSPGPRGLKPVESDHEPDLHFAVDMDRSHVTSHVTSHGASHGTSSGVNFVCFI